MERGEALLSFLLLLLLLRVNRVVRELNRKFYLSFFSSYFLYHQGQNYSLLDVSGNIQRGIVAANNQYAMRIDKNKLIIKWRTRYLCVCVAAIWHSMIFKLQYISPLTSLFPVPHTPVLLRNVLPVVRMWLWIVIKGEYYLLNAGECKYHPAVKGEWREDLCRFRDDTFSSYFNICHSLLFG